MGSPISVVLAEVTLQKFENDALSRAPCNILFWKRYVDDIITAIPTDEIQNLLQYLNNVNNHIKFTVETEEDKTISFLDLNIKRCANGNLSFSVYRKKTHSGKYLDFKSNNPLSHKESVATSLFNRAKLICNDDNKKEEE